MCMCAYTYHMAQSQKFRIEVTEEHRQRAAAILPSSLQQTEVAQAIADAEQRGYVIGLKATRLIISDQLERQVIEAENFICSGARV